MDILCFCSVLCLLCLCARLFICALWSPAGKELTSWLSLVVSAESLSLSHWYPHTGQCKRTGGCYNELVVAFLRTGDGLKGKKKSIPVDFMIYL